MDTVIDHRIRDWVFAPIVIVMFMVQLQKSMVNLFRHYLTIYSEKKTIEKLSSQNEYKDVCDKQQIVRCQNIVKYNGLLSENSFKVRKYHLCKKNGGYLTVRGERVSQVNPMQQMAAMNPNNMTAMLKNNLSMGLSTFFLYTWVNQLFSGFILARVPFPLTQKFRIMLQSGVDIQNLNVRYVSSLSLYFLLLTSLSQIVSIFTGNNKEQQEQELRQKESLTKTVKLGPGGLGPLGGMGAMNPMNQMTGMMNGNMSGQGPDYKKIFENEKENIELIRYHYLLDNAEDELLQKYKTILGHK